MRTLVSRAGVVLGSIIGISLITAPSAHAVYDQFVTWSDMSSLDLRPALASTYGSNANLYEAVLPEAAPELVLRDADNLISPHFHVPADIRPQVAFWLRIYTEFSTQQTVLFDSLHPDVIYDVLDFRDLAKSARNRVVYEILRERRLKAAVAKYRMAFQRLAKNPKLAQGDLKKLSPYERNVVTGHRRFAHKHSFAELGAHLKTQTGQRDNVIKGLLAAESFFPQMDAIFRKNGLPTELTRLVLVESSFDLSAKSRVGAAGVWQFMRPSAKEFMRIDDELKLDERLSPLKATVGAANLLNRGYKMFGNWPLAVVSFNQGLNLPRNLRGREDLPRVFKLFSGCGSHRKLGWAGRNYYAEFLAIVHAEAYRKLFYGNPPSPDLQHTAFTKVAKPVTGLQLAQSSGLTIGEFKFMNPDILDLKRKLPLDFLVALPKKNHSGDIKATQDEIVSTLTRQLRPQRRARRG